MPTVRNKRRQLVRTAKIWLSISLLASCAPSSPPVKDSSKKPPSNVASSCGVERALTPIDPANGTHVLVKPNSTLYEQPNNETDVMVLPDRPVPMRVVAKSKEWAELRTNLQDGRHCFEQIEYLKPFDLRLFVRSSNLLDTNQEPVGFDVSGTAEVTIQPGGYVVESNNKIRVRTSASSFPVDDFVQGKQYSPAPAPEAPEPVQVSQAFLKSILGEASTKLGEKLTDSETIGQTQYRIFEHSRREGKVLELWDDCVDARLVAQKNVAKRAGRLAETLSIGANSIEVSLGQTIYWQTGCVAGRVIQPHSLEPSSIVSQGKQRLCSEFGVGSICFDRQDSSM